MKGFNIPTDNDLHVYWHYKDWGGKKIKTYTVVCKCGNNKLLVHENGIRCIECQHFHTHDSFKKASDKARQAGRMEGRHVKAGIERIPQPFLQQQAIFNRRRALLKQKVKSKIITSWT